MFICGGWIAQEGRSFWQQERTEQAKSLSFPSLNISKETACYDPVCWYANRWQSHPNLQSMGLVTMDPAGYHKDDQVAVRCFVRNRNGTFWVSSGSPFVWMEPSCTGWSSKREGRLDPRKFVVVATGSPGSVPRTTTWRRAHGTSTWRAQPLFTKKPALSFVPCISQWSCNTPKVQLPKSAVESYRKERVQVSRVNWCAELFRWRFLRSTSLFQRDWWCSLSHFHCPHCTHTHTRVTK